MTRKDLIARIMISSLAIPLMLCAAPVHAGNFGIDIHFGIPFRPVIMAPQPVYRQPVSTFYFQETPEFVYQESLGYYVAVDSPYDLFYDNDSYYIYRQGYWHRSSQLNGSWRIVEHRSLPRDFRRHNIEQIRRYRDDREYKVYRQHRRDYPDRRYYSPRYTREHQSRDHEDYREERRPREYDR